MSKRTTATKILATAAAAITPIVLLGSAASAAPGVGMLLISQTADATTNCTAGIAEIRLGNKTNNAGTFDISIDGQHHSSPTVMGNMSNLTTVEMAENETIRITVEAGDKELLDAEVTLDCQHAAPAYHLTEDCEAETAFAVLSNNGTDSANMGVQYPDVMGMNVPVAPGETEHWLLAVDPGETIEFDVIADGQVLGHEVVSFVCQPLIVEPPVPAPVEPAPVVTNPAPEPTQPVEPVPTTEQTVPTTDETEEETKEETDEEQALVGIDSGDSAGGMSLKLVAAGLGLLGVTAGVAAIGETLHRRRLDGQPV